MKLSLILIATVLAKTPHNRDDVEKMSEHERKEFDREILFDSDEVFWTLEIFKIFFEKRQTRSGTRTSWRRVTFTIDLLKSSSALIRMGN